jgi:hypothetical protein
MTVFYKRPSRDGRYSSSLGARGAGPSARICGDGGMGHIPAEPTALFLFVASFQRIKIRCYNIDRGYASISLSNTFERCINIYRLCELSLRCRYPIF